MLGAGLTYLLTNDGGREALNSLPTDLEVNNAQAFFMELILTMILTHTVLMVNDERSIVEGNVDSLSIGLAYAALHFVGVSLVFFSLYLQNPPKFHSLNFECFGKISKGSAQYIAKFLSLIELYVPQ